MALEVENGDQCVENRGPLPVLGKLFSRCQSLSLEGSPFLWKRSVKYLGVTVDRRLSFANHVSQSLQCARGVKPKMYPFLTHWSSVPVRIKLTVYLLFLRAILTSAAPAFWALLSPKIVARLEAPDLRSSGTSQTLPGLSEMMLSGEG